MNVRRKYRPWKVRTTHHLGLIETEIFRFQIPSAIEYFNLVFPKIFWHASQVQNTEFINFKAAFPFEQSTLKCCGKSAALIFNSNANETFKIVLETMWKPVIDMRWLNSEPEHVYVYSSHRLVWKEKLFIFMLNGIHFVFKGRWYNCTF